jgi:UPF0716 protein FxsA
MVKWIIIAILLLPVAEIATFVLAGLLVGFGWALLLMLATTIAGFLVLQRAGRSQLVHLRDAVTASNTAGIEVGTGSFLTVLAGILLVLPGFLTDVAGALLLLGPVRRTCAALIQRAVPGASRDRGVVDLPPEEWKQMPDREAVRRPDTSGRT